VLNLGFLIDHSYPSILIVAATVFFAKSDGASGDEGTAGLFEAHELIKVNVGKGMLC
jgi:hypothetical protein